MRIKSCFLLVFGLTFFTKCAQKNIEIEITKISKEIDETSALEIINGNFLTLNDSGDDPLLYIFDKNGKILSKNLISGAQNRDWESLASDENFVYIGDIGNNMSSTLGVGDLVKFEGRLQSSKYVDSNGVKRTSWSVIPDNFERVSSPQKEKEFQHLRIEDGNIYTRIRD